MGFTRAERPDTHNKYKNAHLKVGDVVVYVQAPQTLAAWAQGPWVQK